MPPSIESIRKRKRISRSSVARHLSLSERHVYRLERGATPWRYQHIVLLAELFGEPVKKLERIARLNGDEATVEQHFAREKRA